MLLGQKTDLNTGQIILNRKIPDHKNYNEYRDSRINQQKKAFKALADFYENLND